MSIYIYIYTVRSTQLNFCVCVKNIPVIIHIYLPSLKIDFYQSKAELGSISDTHPISVVSPYSPSTWWLISVSKWLMSHL